jgi:hypothetical protein
VVAGAEVMEADLVEASMVGAAASTAGASAGITEASVEVAGAAVGEVMAGVEAGVTQAGDAAGVGVIPVGVGELASALVGAGAPIGEGTHMRTAIPIITRITHTTGRTRIRQRTRIGITVAAEIRGTTRSRKILSIHIPSIQILGIHGRRDRLA